MDSIPFLPQSLAQSLLTDLVTRPLHWPFYSVLPLTQGPCPWSCPWLPNLLQVFAQRPYLGRLRELVVCCCFCYCCYKPPSTFIIPPLFPTLSFSLTIMPSKALLLKIIFFTLWQKVHGGKERFLCGFL